MLKVILAAPRPIPPFNEPARDLRIQNTPLWLHQHNVLAPYVTREMENPAKALLPQIRESMLVYRNNLFFDEYYIAEFIRQAKKRKRPVRAAFSVDDPSFREHALPLSTSYTPAGPLYLADLWYYPSGFEADVDPLVIDMSTREMGYYRVPSYMGGKGRELVYYVPRRAMMAIDCWAHVFIVDTVFGLFARGARYETRLENELAFKLKIFATALYEGRQVLECSKVVEIGKDCTIDPTAVIHGPTTIGNNVNIGAGAVIDNCIIGDGVTISQNCYLMLSVIGDGTFLPIHAILFMTTLMDNSTVAQNTCLQMCVVGRNTFIGAGNTFTDFNLLPSLIDNQLVPSEIKALDGKGELKSSKRYVLGGAVGHNCRIGAGLIIYPARMIESDVVLVATKDRRVIDRDVKYEDSDHHKMRNAQMYKRLYPRKGEQEQESW